MRVLVTGATGFIGSHLVKALSDRGHEVKACARNTRALATGWRGVTPIQLEAVQPPRPEEWAAHLRNVDVVINTVGIIAERDAQTFQRVHVEFARRLFDACQTAAVRRVIQISALGAQEGAISPFHQSKHAADTYLRGLDLEKVIVKPSLVFGIRSKSATFFHALAVQPVLLLVDRGRQRVQPVFINDLVEALARLTMHARPPQEIAAVGPVAITFRDMLEAYRRWLLHDTGTASDVRTISLPYPLVLATVRVLDFLKLPFLNADNVQMLQRGNTADAGPITALLGAPPASLDEALRGAPASDADRWHAQLYFLVPLLRYAIALVWIFAGFVSAFVYPTDESFAMLRHTGLSGWMLPAALYSAALLDLALGVAWMRRFHVYAVGVIQLAVIAVYTLIITAFLPDYWLHPFGPLVKNVPLVVAILIVMAVERR